MSSPPISPSRPSPTPSSPIASSSAPQHNPRCNQHPPIPAILGPPPSYHSTMSSISNLGFPPGYFLIRSVANGRVLDIEGNDTKDGARVILWPEKESSLVEGLRNPNSDNQVYFVDAYGALCCRENGHALDVHNGRLVLRHRRPVTYPYPNAYSHPLPQFSYNPSTGVINVAFSCDPSYPQITHQSVDKLDQSWRQKSFIVTTLPERKQRTFADDASDAIIGALTNPISFVGSFTASLSGTSQSNPSTRGTGTGATTEADYDLRDDEVVEEERADAEEIDDSPELLRQVRVIAVDDPDAQLHPKTRDRRRWEVVPLRTSKAGWTR